MCVLRKLFGWLELQNVTKCFKNVFRQAATLPWLMGRAILRDCGSRAWGGGGGGGHVHPLPQYLQERFIRKSVLCPPNRVTNVPPPPPPISNLLRGP